MLGCEMDKFILGMIVGAVLNTVLFSVANGDADKEAAKVGWIKIDGEFYTLRKADVVEVKSKN